MKPYSLLEQLRLLDARARCIAEPLHEAAHSQQGSGPGTDTMAEVIQVALATREVLRDGFARLPARIPPPARALLAEDLPASL